MNRRFSFSFSNAADNVAIFSSAISSCDTWRRGVAAAAAALVAEGSGILEGVLLRRGRCQHYRGGGELLEESFRIGFHSWLGGEMLFLRLGTYLSRNKKKSSRKNRAFYLLRWARAGFCFRGLLA